MKQNKFMQILSIFTLLLVFTAPSANAFSFLGVDFGEVWDSITFWDDDEPQSQNTGGNSNKTSKPAQPFPITVANYTVSNVELVNVINTNPSLEPILKEITYDCLYVKSDKQLDITVYFKNNKATKVVKGNHCDDEVIFEESLIEDLKGGFNAKQIPSYLKKVEMPMGLYYKLAKANI